jgi:hypothetical protein
MFSYSTQNVRKKNDDVKFEIEFTH